MIRINRLYIDRFKYFGNSYNFQVMNGVWLSFDKNTLEYVGYELFGHFYHLDFISKECNTKINELLAKDLLEVI